MAELSDDLCARMQKVAVDAYRALRVRDYGRIDLRLTAAGEIYVIEVNASCYLERTGEFATAAAAAGMDYPSVIQRIVELSMERQSDHTTRRRNENAARHALRSWSRRIRSGRLY